MSQISFHHPDGTIETIEAEEGVSIMRTALVNSVDGIIGECGGQAMCATCHVYVKDGDNLPAVEDEEDEMLDCTTAERLPNSRLSCQLVAGRDFETIEVQIPTSQH